jgi:hypothetical protein
MRFIPKNVNLNLPFGLGGVSVDISQEESAQAAWRLYVEYSTRIATEELPKGQGSVREALSSIHALFGITRTILQEGGLDLVREGKNESVGTVAIRILNEGIRPNLVKWHSSLSAFEAKTWREWIETGHQLPDHPALASALVDETAWPDYAMFYQSLAQLQQDLRTTVEAFARMAGVVQEED